MIEATHRPTHSQGFVLHVLHFSSVRRDGERRTKREGFTPKKIINLHQIPKLQLVKGLMEINVYVNSSCFLLSQTTWSCS